MDLDISAVVDKQIKDVRSGELVTIKSLWEKQTTVIVFFRRWGCLLCRVWAKQLEDLYPALQESNIRLVGIGVDEIGLEDFVQGKYFPGDLFIDSTKSVYSGLKLKRFNIVTILLSLLTGESRAAIAEGRSKHLGGDFKGDGLQNGGALVVRKGGEVLYSFRQERPAQHVSNEKFAEILGIKYTPSAGNDTKEQVVCNDDQCSR